MLVVLVDIVGFDFDDDVVGVVCWVGYFCYVEWFIVFVEDCGFYMCGLLGGFKKFCVVLILFVV